MEPIFQQRLNQVAELAPAKFHQAYRHLVVGVAANPGRHLAVIWIRALPGLWPAYGSCRGLALSHTLRGLIQRVVEHVFDGLREPPVTALRGNTVAVQGISNAL